MTPRESSERATAWAKANPERRKAIEAKYRATPKAKAAAAKRNRNWLLSNRARHTATKRRWEKNHQKQTTAAVCHRLKTAYNESRDWYVAKLLRTSGVKNPNHEQIENYRKLLQSKRSRHAFRALAGAAAISH